MVRVPTIVYRAGGKGRHFSKWGPWSSKGVNTLEEYSQALADGWHPTQAEAFGLVKPAPVVEQIEDNAPPTRDEMLAKAAEIGLAVDRRWSDKTLANKIIEALEAVPDLEPVP
jgi:hypothetical protein